MKPTLHCTTLFLITACLLLTTAEQTYAQWATDPAINNAICTATGGQYSPTIVSDGAGGAIITWQDTRTGTNNDIYAQRINASGTVQWTANGDTISAAIGDQSSPTIVSDGSGGAIITWHDTRSGSNYDLYAQRMNASGTVQWTADGVAIRTLPVSGEFPPTIVSDGTGGAIITWYDNRSGNDDIYAQRINASGTVQWTANGNTISTAIGNQQYPTIVSDGTGGAIITWHDTRSGPNFDIYAQRINASGTVQWTLNAVEISTTTNGQSFPSIVSDGSGGAIITWNDGRSGTGSDIYAQRIYEGAALPVELVSFTAQARSSGVELSWNTATEVNNYGFDIERRTTPLSPPSQGGDERGGWTKAGFVEGNGTTNLPHNYLFTDNSIASGKHSYRLKQIDRDGQFTYSQEVEFTVGSVPSEFALMQNYPNPFNPSTRIEFTVPENGRATLKIYDLLGQEVATLFDGDAEAGRSLHTTFDATRLAGGMYFSKLQFSARGGSASGGNGKQLVRKMLMVK